jgi:hypothetical protein
MDADVVKARQEGLERYMTAVVEAMPEVLASSYLDVFLNLKNRITVITSKIQQEERIAHAKATEAGEEYDETKMVSALPKVVPGGLKELSGDGCEGGMGTSAKSSRYSIEQEKAIRAINVLVCLVVVVSL